MIKNYTIVFLLPLLLLTSCFNAPDNIEATITHPISVEKGEDFNITVTVTNNNPKEHELRNIDFDADFFEGIYLKESTPSGEQFEALGLFFIDFFQTIPPHSTEQVIFYARGIKSGDYSTEVGVCIDGDSSCILKQVRIIVD